LTVDIDALLAKYPPKPVGLYGNCMVIPTKEFDSTWEAGLRREGFATFAKFGNEFEGPCVLVRIKPTQSTQSPAEVKPVFQPVKQPVQDSVKIHTVKVNNNLRQPRWTGAELKLVKDLRGQRLSNEELAAAFQKVYPKRSASGIVAKACQLARSGEVKPLKKLKKRSNVKVPVKPVKTTKVPDSPVASSAKVDQIKSRTYQLTILIQAENFASASSVSQRIVEKYPKEALITCMKEVQGNDGKENTS